MSPATTVSVGVLLVPHTLLFAVGVALVLAGTYLRCKLAHHWMRAEEHAKEGWLSEEQVRRRVAFLRYGGPFLILLGGCAFALVLAG